MRPIDAAFFPYPGGKARQRRSVARFLPQRCGSYIEPFAGRGNIFFLARRIVRTMYWHLNDLKSTPFLNAVRRYDGHPLPVFTKSQVSTLSDTDQLLLGPITYWAGGWSNPTGNRGHDMEDYRLRLLKASADLLGVKITVKDACDVLQDYIDTDDAFIYLDPPYQGCNVSAYSSTDVDRDRMYKLLRRARCSFLLSEYRNSSILGVLGEPAYTYKAINNPVPGQPGVEKVECLWSNVPGLSPRIIDFGDVQQPLKLTYNLLQASGELDASAI